ncbi:hypothetical protein JL722_5396 [Aureococcus anophagefferens]|nr:hypothetical protein JL722_5396 [Aureococcus anophagefferens]
MSPQLVGEGLQQFTQYAVRTRSTCAHYGRSEMRVLRRFSDFEWCRERLRGSRPGVVVPPLLSPKRWANNTSHDFVRERMESLTRFANRVVAHPKLRGSLEVQALLDASPAGLEQGDSTSLQPRAPRLERAIQRLAAARAGGVDGSQRVHVATARLEAARAARDASVAAERAVDGALAGEQGRFEAGRALELRGALLEYAATNLGFVKRNSATWHQLKDAMQPTDVEAPAAAARPAAPAAPPDPPFGDRPHAADSDDEEASFHNGGLEPFGGLSEDSVISV